MYVLPVRALRTDRYNGSSYLRHETLATAIAKECFTGMRAEKEFTALRNGITASLKQPTTLVILDGLDEQHNTSQSILREAKAGNHKLLVTSRSYGIPETERAQWGDIEVDNVGLDEKQRDKFIDYAFAEESTPDLAARLISFIKAQNLKKWRVCL